jgi:hypothetical protein
MRRMLSSIVLLVGLLAAVTFGIALVDVLMPGAAPALDATGAVQEAGTSRGVIYAGFGLAAGLMLASASRIDWSSVPQRLRLWLAVQRRRAAWIALGCASASVLLFY